MPRALPYETLHTSECQVGDPGACDSKIVRPVERFLTSAGRRTRVARWAQQAVDARPSPTMTPAWAVTVGFSALSRMFVDRIDPVDGLRFLHRLNIQVHYHRLIVATHQHTLQRLVCRRIDLLMRDIRRDEDEITSSASATYSSFSPQRMRALPRST